MTWPFPIRPPFPPADQTVVRVANWESRACLHHDGVYWVGAHRRCFVDGCRGAATTSRPPAKSGHEMRFSDAS